VDNLLEVMTISPSYLKKGAIPLAMEFPVDVQTAPYLVSSSNSLVWVSEAPSSTVRGAVRRGLELGDLFCEVASEIAEVGREARWGNSHPYSLDGVMASIKHVKGYGLSDVQLICSLGDTLLGSREEYEGCKVAGAKWVPSSMILAVPSDRGFVGFALRLNNKDLISVVHNASRGVGVAWG